MVCTLSEMLSVGTYCKISTTPMTEMSDKGLLVRISEPLLGWIIRERQRGASDFSKRL